MGKLVKRKSKLPARNESNTCFAIIFMLAIVYLVYEHGSLESFQRTVQKSDSTGLVNPEGAVAVISNSISNTYEKKGEEILVAVAATKPTTAKNESQGPSTQPTTVDNAAVATNEDSGARFFIHVGPVKTGSSSIQCNLQVNPFLKESSYEFMGRRETDKICPKTSYPETKRKFWDLQAFVFRYVLRGWLKQDAHQDYVKRFKTVFRDKFEKRIHTIFSAEEFCGLLQLDPPKSKDDDRLQSFANLLNDIPQFITFHVVYRHSFDVLLSTYNFYEIYNNGNEMSMQKKRMISILDANISESSGCSPYKIWKFLREKLIPLLDRADLEVFNFHGKDLATRYICNLPDSQAACQKSKSLQLKRARPTQKDILHSDRIATAAWEKGIYSNSSNVKTKRKEVREIIIDHVRNNLNMRFLELPTECLPDDVLSKMHSHSVRIGTEMLGDKFDENHLESLFSKSKSEKSFCSVNVTAVFEDPEWKVFLRNMKISV